MKEVHILNREEFEETAVQLYSLIQYDVPIICFY